MVIHILMHFCSFVYKPHKAARHPTKCDVINYIKLFPSRIIYIVANLTLFNQMSRHNIKCTRIGGISQDGILQVPDTLVEFGRAN